MLNVMDPALFWGLLALQLVGLASVVLARMPCRCPLKSTCCRAVFFACLFGVAAATMLAIDARSGLWAWCGTTFSLMAVGATFDGRSTAAATGF
jgi:hypothetical protein